MSQYYKRNQSSYYFIIKQLKLYTICCILNIFKIRLSSNPANTPIVFNKDVAPYISLKDIYIFSSNIKT